MFKNISEYKFKNDIRKTYKGFSFLFVGTLVEKMHTKAFVNQIN